VKVGKGNVALSPADDVTMTLYVPLGKSGKSNEPTFPFPITIPVATGVSAPNVTV
jgi:hypothetical protein